MSLDLYLRSVVREKMLKYLNLCACEKCGNANDLEIHHTDIYFFEMVDKTLKDLGILYHQEKEMYSKEELEKISTYLLGLHLKSTYTILCKSCHKEHHKNQTKRRKRCDSGSITRQDRYIKKLQDSSHANQFLKLLEELQFGLHQELFYEKGTCKKQVIREFLGIDNAANFANKVLNKDRVIEYCRKNAITTNGQKIIFNSLLKIGGEIF